VIARHHESRAVAVRVPATTANLGPGFDALGAALTRYLYAGIVDADQAARVHTDGEGAGEVATGDDNLVWRSFVAFCEHVGAPVPDVGLRVRNDIPLERGLGSSSAAIVGGLALARAATGAAVGDLDLVRVASAIEGHPDNVAPAVLGGFVACAQTDDGSLVVRRAQPAAAVVVVAVPGDRQNTGEARAALPEALARGDAATQAARAAHVAPGLLGVWPVDARLAGDLLHEPSRFAVMPGSADLVRAMRDEGMHAWLSGAGPTVAAVAHDRASQERLVELSHEHGFAPDVLAWDLAGTVACPSGGCAFSGIEGCTACPRARL
jgi:homoserine kinase